MTDRRPLDPRLVRRSAAVRRYVVAAVALATLSAGTVVASSWLIADVVSRGFDGEGVTDTVTALLAALALALGARAVLGWVQTVVAARASVRVKADLRAEIVDRALAAEPAPAGRAAPTSTALATLLGPGLDKLDPYFARFLPQLFLAATVPLTVVVAIAFADPLSAVTIAVTLPLVIVFLALVGQLTRERTERRWRSLVRLSHHFADVLDGLVVLKVFGRSANQTEGLARVGDRNRTTTMSALRTAFLSSFVLELVATISVALVAVSIGLRIVHGEMALVTGLFVLVLAPEAYLPVRQVGTHFHDSAEGRAVADDAFAVLEGPRPARSVRPPDLSRARVVVASLTVAYPDRAAPALDGLDLTVRPGAFVAVTGPSGCGKSTLIDVLLGFVRPTGGRVSIVPDDADGPDVDLADVDLAAWRSQIAWVPQVPVLLAGTVGSNVALGAPDATATDVAAALRDVGADDLAPTRPVVEAGADLSAGQVRRVALARALLRVRSGGGRLLLLDEPTAGLDSEREQHAVDAVRAAGATVLVVAHRAAFVDAADTVVELAVPAVPR
ncbi:ATP-binding cassette subfamily C protein CydD [Mumia flava]|uniref:ATP-binding cassette subfamily C protein CydD n=1 Tax=Mumia flava TaxID=1348852 RepID=A0A0B2BGS8_9ACTN|nr:thiol reductant ABC exporter subunit CydD [Mumia flava]PJJ56393.1 ATP-binding cassette subfamily C protein CydD [Mumia flava]